MPLDDIANSKVDKIYWGWVRYPRAITWPNSITNVINFVLQIIQSVTYLGLVFLYGQEKCISSISALLIVFCMNIHVNSAGMIMSGVLFSIYSMLEGQAGIVDKKMLKS